MQGDDAADAVLIGHERPDDFYCTAEECVSAIADRGGPKLAVAVTVGTHEVDVAGQPVLTVLQDDGGSAAAIAARRSEERRVGTECDSTCRPRGSPMLYKKKKIISTTESQY